MPKQTVLVKVNPNVVRWALESGGWDVNELAKKSNISEDIINKLQSKETKIELTKLEKIAKCVKRPLAVFFLPKPPIESELTDYRKIAGTKKEKLSKKTLAAIRESRYLQSVSKELLEMQSMNMKPKIRNYSLKFDPEEVAKIERIHLGFESEDELLSKETRKSTRIFYNKLREKIESFNIFVYQLSMSIEEARGFTLTDGFPRTIVVNSADSYKPKIFTLLHEYAHILLKTDGICMPNSNLPKNNNDELQRVETWCNVFAGSVLMPRQEFLDQASKWEEKLESPKEIINKLSSQFNASKQAVVVRMLRINPKTSFSDFYQTNFEEIKKEEMTKTKKKGKGGPHPIDICLSQKGRKFVSLVFESKEKQMVNYSDVIDYLHLNLKYFDNLQKRL